MKRQYFLIGLQSLVCLVLLIFQMQVSGQNIREFGPPFDFEPGNEFDPAFSNDGKQMAFVSDKTGQFKLYLSVFLNNKWTEPFEIESINNFNQAKGNIRHPSFNYNGNVLYFSADFYADSSNVDIFYSVKTGDDWSEPRSIGPPVNSLGYDGQPSISADDLTLYFTRNYTSSIYPNIDCKRIFMSRRSPDGVWEKPEELPVPINVDCEQLPRISLDNKTLYFSSLRDGGKGGFDIYRSKLIAKNVWVPAESLDTMNSTTNDFAPTIFFNNNLALFSIERLDKKVLSSKIYSVDMPPQFLPGTNIRLKGIIKETSIQKPLEGVISVYNPVTSRLISRYSNNAATGEYDLFLPGGSDYLIDFNKDGFSHSYLNVEATYKQRNELLEKDIFLFKDIVLILNVFDNEIFKPVNARIEIRNSKKELLPDKINIEKEGRYRIKIPLGDMYTFNLEADYFEAQNFEFDLTGIVQFDEFERDIELAVNKVDFQIDISDEDSKSGLPVEVLITNIDNNEVVRTTAIATSDGKYIVKLREGDRYNISVSPKGYSYYNTTVDLKKKEAPKKLDVKLKQLKEDTKLTLKNITFEFNSADLNLSSFEELDRVVKLLVDNPNINIEISAHTDNTGSDAYNLRLSKRRAKAVMDYLVDQKISPKRIISQGYGKARPLVPNDSDENKALNRRVELKIIKID
jgi:outer membrane protein OmpA-like peptidoglycan-associated protein